MIADMINDQDQNYWKFQFTRVLQPWEEDQLQTLSQLLSVVQLQDDSEDCLQWKWSKDLSFSVKLAYSKWEDQSFLENKELLSLWRNICPPKTELFAWMAVQDCIAAKTVLVRRGVIPGDQATCTFCKSEEESPSHLLLHCHFSWEIWSEIIAWWNLVWICPQSLMQVFHFWSNIRFRNLEKLCWYASYYATIWTIWTSRNESVFKHKVWTVEEIVELVKTRVAIWIKGKYDIKDYSVDDFRCNLAAIRRVRI
ncbi:hypothetical protein RHGRI_033441 [Rhododendron griersonianum]|nr:hypothetical protein RHGRI_033441 [Rhododendron griersonianum]